MDMSSLRIVVVGGAIAGASTALALARAGARVTLCEREASARAAGAGIALAENGLAVLDALGFGTALAASSSELSGVRVADAQGRALFTPSGRGTRVRMARRSTLYAALAQAVAAEPRIDARYGTEWDGGSEPANLIVGADGAHSRVRTALGFRARVRKSGIAYLRALAPSGLARNEEAWTSAGLFGSFAIPDGTYFYASLGSAKARRALANRDLAALRDAWAPAYRASGALFDALPSFEALLINDVIHVECASFVHGNAVLVGDAAHAMAPNLGQGANSALVDAAVLCDELARAESLASGLAAYDRRRRPRVMQTARTAARLGALAELTHPVLRSLRDRVLMPLASRGDGEAATRMALQEDPETLRTALR